MDSRQVPWDWELMWSSSVVHLIEGIFAFTFFCPFLSVFPLSFQFLCRICACSNLSSLWGSVQFILIYFLLSLLHKFVEILSDSSNWRKLKFSSIFLCLSLFWFCRFRVSSLYLLINYVHANSDYLQIVFLYRSIFLHGGDHFGDEPSCCMSCSRWEFWREES